MRYTKTSPKRRAVLNERAHAPTPSEAALFRLLSAGKLGVGFKRQVPLGGFIADFVAASAKLVIEVDGLVHLRRRGADARKDRALRRLGYRVLRLEAKLVIEQPLVAVALLRKALAPSPTPQRPPP